METSKNTISSADDKIYTLDQFLTNHKEKSTGKSFELESDRILELKADNGVWIKSGSMISYKGDVQFVRESVMEFGIKKLLKGFISTEGSKLTKASGNGSVYVADNGKKITLLKLKNETIIVNGNDVLAFEKGVKWDIEMMKGLGAMVSGGLFNMKLSGSGHIAISCHNDPLVLEVGGKNKITTDPHATVAWSGGVKPAFKAQTQFKTFFGRGSGDTVQMSFTGKGFVIVQPYEELSFNAEPMKPKKAPAIAGVFVFLMMAGSVLNGFGSATRKPASISQSGGQIMNAKLEIKRLDTIIKGKGTKATEAERNKLRSLKRSLRALQEK